MSGSALDEMTADELAMMRQMQQDDQASAHASEVSASEHARGEPAAPVIITEAEPAAPAESEPAADDADALVPKRALFEERDRRRKAEVERHELAAKHAADLARVQTRLEMLAQAAEQHLQQQQPTPKPPEPEPIPDFNENPAGFIQGNLASMQQAMAAQQAQLARMEQQFQEQQRQYQVQQQREQLRGWGTVQEAELTRELPDYRDAANYLYGVQERSQRVLGNTDPVGIQRAIEEQVLQTAAFAQRNNMNFGRMVYDLAKAAGYTPAQAQAQMQTANAVVAQHQQPQAQPPAMIAMPPAPAMPPTSPQERLLRGQDMATTLGATGAAPRGQISSQAIADMPDQDFAKIYERVLKDPNAMRTLFGS